MTIPSFILCIFTIDANCTYLKLVCGAGDRELSEGSAGER